MRLADEERAPERLLARCAELLEGAFAGERRAEAGEVLEKLARQLKELRPRWSQTAELADAVCAVAAE